MKLKKVSLTILGALTLCSVDTTAGEKRKREEPEREMSSAEHERDVKAKAEASSSSSSTQTEVERKTEQLSTSATQHNEYTKYYTHETESEYQTPVRSIAISPDGNTVALAQGDEETDVKTVKLFDLKTKAIIATWKISNVPNSLAFSPNNKLLAVGTAYGSIQLWNLTTRTLQQTLLHQARQPVIDLAFNPNGTFLASGHVDGPVKLWNMRSLTFADSLPDTDNAYHVRYSPNGLLLAVGSDSYVTLWDAKTKKLLVTLDNDGFNVESIAFNPTNQSLAVGDNYGIIRLWNLTNIHTPHVLVHQGGNEEINSLEFRNDGKILAAGSRGGTITLWNTSTLTIQETLTLDDSPDSRVACLAFSPNGEFLAAGFYTDTKKEFCIWRKEGSRSSKAAERNAHEQTIREHILKLLKDLAALQTEHPTLYEQAYKEYEQFLTKEPKK